MKTKTSFFRVTTVLGVHRKRSNVSGRDGLDKTIAFLFNLSDSIIAS